MYTQYCNILYEHDVRINLWMFNVGTYYFNLTHKCKQINSYLQYT